MSLFWWAILLLAQNASFTWVSRARNSGSDWYHATASVFSNAIWFAAMYGTFDFIDQIRAGGWGAAVKYGGVYTGCTVVGSVAAGWFLRRFIERGSRRVGYYHDGRKKS